MNIQEKQNPKEKPQGGENQPGTDQLQRQRVGADADADRSGQPSQTATRTKGQDDPTPEDRAASAGSSNLEESGDENVPP